jgi:N-acetylmuramoyl-L-alanine amidase
MLPLFLVLTAILCVAVWLLGGSPWGKGREAHLDATNVIQDSLAQTAPITCIVIDAGHGGEDGGASSAEGLAEKEINLEVAFALRDMLEAAGIPVEIIRKDSCPLSGVRFDGIEEEKQEKLKEFFKKVFQH